MARNKLKQVRQESIRKRKNFLPTLLITILFWIALAGLVYFTLPASLTIFVFFVLLFWCLLFSFSIIFISQRRGLISAAAVTLFLLLRFFGIGNIINLLLILGVAICIELYFSRK